MADLKSSSESAQSQTGGVAVQLRVPCCYKNGAQTAAPQQQGFRAPHSYVDSSATVRGGSAEPTQLHTAGA